VVCSLCLAVEVMSQEDHVPIEMHGYRLARWLEIRRWFPAGQAMKSKRSPCAHGGNKGFNSSSNGAW